MSARDSVRKAFRLASQLLKISCRNPRRLSHVLGTALAACYEVADPALDILRLPHVSVEDLLPIRDADRITLQAFPKTNASVSPIETVALILLLRRTGARNIFEFGTYKGASITQLALNARSNSRIYTLDLPETQTGSRLGISDPEDVVIAFEPGKGELIPVEFRDQISFVRQDSGDFDEGPFAQQMDFVFVDGAHNTAYVRNDSEKAWRMLKPSGIVAWHDCRVQDPAVVRYLLESSYAPMRITGTTLAFAVKH